MPECGNCGRHVTPDYERVHKPEHLDHVRTCPDCEYIREEGGVRKMKTTGHLDEPTQLLADGNGAKEIDWTDVEGNS